MPRCLRVTDVIESPGQHPWPHPDQGLITALPNGGHCGNRMHCAQFTALVVRTNWRGKSSRVALGLSHGSDGLWPGRLPIAAKMIVYRAIPVVLTVACGLCAAVMAPLAVMTAVMAFDAPGSEQKVWVWVGSLAILSIPLWFVAGAILGWMLHLRGWPRSALLVAASPLIIAVGVGGVLFVE